MATERLAAMGRHPSRSPCPATDGAGSGSDSGMASGGTVSDLWQASWAQLRAAFPDLEARLAQLERERPTRFRALQRLQASAGRWAGRVMRGEATAAQHLKKLLTWQTALVAELERKL
jgi:hypothetical protein